VASGCEEEKLSYSCAIHGEEKRNDYRKLKQCSAVASQAEALQPTPLWPSLRYRPCWQKPAAL